MRFARGELTTAFIPEEYPDGYDGHVLSADEHGSRHALQREVGPADARARTLCSTWDSPPPGGFNLTNLR